MFLYTLPVFANCQDTSKEAGIIRGHILSKTDTFGIPGAKIILQVNSANSVYLTQTSGNNGEFAFIIPDSVIRKRLKIRVYCVGCTPKVIVVKKVQLPINDLRIAMDWAVINDDFE